MSYPGPDLYPSPSLYPDSAPEVSQFTGLLLESGDRLLLEFGDGLLREVIAINGRRLGGLIVTVLWHPSPASQEHVRAVGALAVRGHLTIGPSSLTHTRQSSIPQLSARVAVDSLSHSRQLNAPEVNSVVIAVDALDRVLS